MSKEVATDRVALMGLLLVATGTSAFYYLPGMITADAKGSKLVNSFYCSVITLTTIGFGDICPGEPDAMGRTFLTIFPLLGLGFFCGPILTLTSTWQKQFPGGPFALAVFTLAMGVSMLTSLENLSLPDALHLCVVLGTTIGYGDITPSSDMGRFMVAIYAILALNVLGGLLDIGRQILERICTKETPKKSKQKTKAPPSNISSKEKTKRRKEE